jgi:hypothetical protein
MTGDNGTTGANGLNRTTRGHDMDDGKTNPEFEQWTYTGKDPQTNMPWVTTMLYRVCGQDGDKFDEAVRILQAAFEAGQASAGTKAD